MNECINIRNTRSLEMMRKKCMCHKLHLTMAELLHIKHIKVFKRFHIMHEKLMFIYCSEMGNEKKMLNEK